jgi:hypothetical protein
MPLSVAVINDFETLAAAMRDYGAAVKAAVATRIGACSGTTNSGQSDQSGGIPEANVESFIVRYPSGRADRPRARL